MTTNKTTTTTTTKTKTKIAPKLVEQPFVPTPGKSGIKILNPYPGVDTVRKMLKDSTVTDDDMVEIINITFQADKDYILREPNQEYIEREIQWYKSQSLYVDDIPGDTPQIWKQVSSTDGKINSNYGWCIFSADNNYQYVYAREQLLKDKNTRKAIMIYTRPSMQTDYNKNGMSDFMCTNNVQLYIRNNKLIYCVNQRSCDAVFGYPNDLAWHKFVYEKLMADLQDSYPELQSEYIQYTCGSLHVYPRHQHLLAKI